MQTWVARRGREQAVLGSQKKWTLSFEVRTVEPKAKKPPAEAVEGSLELVVHYRRRPAEVHRSPLPWNSSFAGRLVVCRPGVATVSGTDPEEAPSGLMREVKPAPPPPGSVIFQVKLQSLLLQAEALRGLVARCLQGQVLPAPGSAGGLATKAPQLFARLCLFPGKPKMQARAGSASRVPRGASAPRVPWHLFFTKDMVGPPVSVAQ